jgi:3-isopropylmalate/(R)-2-methylmalate dehydratase small subunit
MRRAQESAGYELTVDLEEGIIADKSGFSAAFEVGSFQRYCLLEGLDDIALTLKHEDTIKAYEASR